MPKASVTRLIERDKDKLINFVLDIEKYPEFIPFCIDSKVYDKKENDNGINIIETAEWRYYGSEDSKINDPTRCGGSSNNLLYNMSCGTMISSKGNSPEVKRLRTIHKFITSNYNDRAILKIFDFIHSLDNQKLADVLSKTQTNTNKSIKYFIQVNIGNELQKSGIPVKELDAFYTYCSKEKNLDVVGLMIIPPNDGDPKKYFKVLDELNNSLALNELSMGMSSDYKEAIGFNATFVRLGSSIFGSRS